MAAKNSICFEGKATVTDDLRDLGSLGDGPQGGSAGRPNFGLMSCWPRGQIYNLILIFNIF